MMRIAIILVMAETSATDWADHARAELRGAGARSGGARDAVIEHLAAQDCCLSAQELFDGLRDEGRTVGIASIYRTLDQLAELRLVHRVDFGHGITRFEAAHPGRASTTTTSSVQAAGRSTRSTIPVSSAR